MASINGISVKGLKEFVGHEGEPLAQGNLYLNNKKIGFWSQDSWGGPDRFNLDAQYSERRLNDAVSALNPERTIQPAYDNEPISLKYDLELLLCDYLLLAAEEKTYKQAVKKGYAGVLIATDGYHQTVWSLPKSYCEMSDDVLLKELGSDIEKTRASFFKETDHHKHEIKIYRSPDDFIIGTPIPLKEIMVKRDLGDIIADAQRSAESGKQPEQGISGRSSDLDREH